ncbi:MAG: tetratricopeptide repeat protein, partial [Pirellulales bacterium]|nr:tetratricopeptide repeat protein [Pirellulales bacterium]
SHRERLAKWARRHPKILTVMATVALLLVVLGGYGGWRDLRRLSLAENLLAEADVAEDARDSRQSAHTLLAAQNAINHQNTVIPERFTATRRDALNKQLAALATRVARSELRRFEQLADVERRAVLGRSSAKGLSQLDADPLGIYRVLDRHDWEQLPYYRLLDIAGRARVDDDITELLVSRVVAMEENGNPDSATDDHVASAMLDMLARVPAIYRESPVIKLLCSQARYQHPGRVDTAKFVDVAESELDYYLAGVIAAQRGQFTTAIECLETAMKLRPEDKPPRFWARFLHAHCCERVQRDEEAIADYGICIGLRGDFAWPYHNLGLIYTKRGRYALAAKNLQEAVRLDPNLADAYANLGVAQFQMGQFSDALRSFDRAIDRGFETADVYSNRAAAREALGDYQGARGDLEHALKLDPDSEAARRNLKKLDENR